MVLAGSEGIEEGIVVTACEHGRHQPSLPGQLAMTDGEDAAMDAMKAADRKTVIDLAVLKVEVLQLPSRNDPVLSLGDVCDQLIIREFCPIIREN